MKLETIKEMIDNHPAAQSEKVSTSFFNGALMIHVSCGDEPFATIKVYNKRCAVRLNTESAIVWVNPNALLTASQRVAEMCTTIELFIIHG